MSGIRVIGAQNLYINDPSFNGVDVAVELEHVGHAEINNMLAINTDTAVKGRKVGKLITDNIVHHEKTGQTLSLADSIRMAINGYV